jgi:alkaline phosphatase D
MCIGRRTSDDLSFSNDPLRAEYPLFSREEGGMKRNGRGLSITAIDRRTFIAGAGAIAVTAPALIGWAFGQTRRWQQNPFSLGVAAGAPIPDGFMLWTRLAPDALSTDPAAPGGMPEPIEIGYEIANDAEMHDIVQHGTAIADPAYAYSVHLDVRGLQPGRPYWYRFTSGDAVSRTGLARTAPTPGSALDRLRLAVASCSNYEHGYFAAYRHLADEQPDFVLFLGDYIYEYAAKHPRVRVHSDGVEAVTLAGYRNRYAQYRLDADLQRVHAEVPALITWDDHEVQNDYADEWSQTFDDPEAFLKRRTAAYQAFYEHMPVRAELSHPAGPAMRIYDRFAFGDLAEVSLLDGRQYRSREACYGPRKGGGHLESNSRCPERQEAQRSMLGAQQEAWLYDGLAQSKARWNILAQDVMMAQLKQTAPDGEAGFWTDDWNGYPAARSRLLSHIHDSHVANPVVLSGDIHSFWTNDLKLDFDDPSSPVVATEFVGTSISSDGPSYAKFRRYLADNPHVRFFESRARGYVSLEVSPERMTAQYRAITDVTDPGATVLTLKSFVVENGKPGATET